jgi:Thiol-activated cytolysin
MSGLGFRSTSRLVSRLAPRLAPLFTALGTLATGCTTAESHNPDGATIDDVLAGIGALPADQPRRVESSPAAPVTDGDYRCVTTSVDEVRRYDQLLGQIAVGDVLWPGDVLRGDSVVSGQLTPLALDRRPVTFSVSLESLSGTHSATLEHPSLSGYRDAIGAILAQDLHGSASAKIYAEVDEVSSDQQLSIALGASVSAPLVAMVKAGFNFGDTKKHGRYLVKFFQIYYTADVDPPGAPHEFFADTVTADQVAAAVSATNPPVYVSSIAYGRQVLFTFESDYSQDELGAALDFVYQGGPEISGSISATHQEVLSHTHTTAFLLGGNSGEAAQASIGSYDELKAFIAHGGEYTKDSPGAAIAYKLSYVGDLTPVQISYASDYQRRSCERISQRVHVSLDKITVDSGGPDASLQLFGYVDTYGSVIGVSTLFDRAEANYIDIASMASFPPSGTIGEAIVTVDPHPGSSLTLSSHLTDHNNILADVDLGVVTAQAPFEAGWRRTLQVHHTAAGRQVTLSVTLQPI